MTLLLERDPIETAEMSVVDRNFDTKEEVKSMTASSAFGRQLDAPAGRRARPHGLDRAVMRLSLAMLIWARKRAETSHDERALRVIQARATEQREHESALRAARVR